MSKLKESPPQGALFERDGLLRPFLKWAGGKRQLLPKIREYFPSNYNLYFEPFVGAGAVLFDLQPGIALINDINSELINCYQVIRDDPKELIASISLHPNTEEHFYHLRSLDREPGYVDLSPVERASRIFFLNKKSFNGLYRVNSRGHFNVPFNKNPNPVIVDEDLIRAISRYLGKARIEMSSADFEDAVSGAGNGDFVYLDPPYDPLSDTASFTGYDVGGFGRKEHGRLKSLCDDLTRRGCKVLLSNSATDFVRSLYCERRKYRIIEIEARRSINSVADGRGKLTELLISNNYELK